MISPTPQDEPERTATTSDTPERSEATPDTPERSETTPENLAERHIPHVTALGQTTISSPGSQLEDRMPVEVFTLLSNEQKPRDTCLIILQGTVQGHMARVLVDSGASRNFVNDDFLTLCQVSTTKLPQRIRVRNAHGGIVHTRQSANLPLQINTFKDTIEDCVATCLAGYDIILGKPWLTRHNPDINWKNNTVMVGSTILQGSRCEELPSVAVLNASRMSKLLRKGKVAECYLATIKEVTDDTLHCKTPSSTTSPPSSIDTISTDFGVDYTNNVRNLLHGFSNLSEPKHMPPRRSCDHPIDLTSPQPPASYNPRLSPAELKEVRRQLDIYLERGWVRPSTSPYSAPIVLVRKKDGSIRVAIDYRGLNAITVRNAYPLPRIDMLMDQLHGAKCFTSLDLWSGYHQVRIRENDIPKTAFRTRYGLYEFTVMPFGLTNAPATFMNLMHNVLHPFLDKFVVVYLDDILIYSRTPKEHLHHVRQVLEALEANHLHIKLSKCSFGKRHVNFLGHIIEDGTIRIDPAKIEAVTKWPIPKNIKEVQAFLGFTAWLRPFISHYAEIAAPLTTLTRGKPAPSSPINWTKACHHSFQELKTAVTNAPVLLIPDTSPHATFTLWTDASGVAVAGILFQDQGQGLQPVAYTSRQYNTHEANYTPREQELLAIVHALDTWRCYLADRKFIVYTDHEALRTFFTQRPLTGRLGRWLESSPPMLPSWTSNTAQAR